MPKAVFLTPTIDKPYDVYADSMIRSIGPLAEAGWEHGLGIERFNPYISAARATLLRKAMDDQPDAIVFIDHDLSWGTDALLTLLQTEGDVVAGTYRFKTEKEEYMGAWEIDEDLRPVTRADGCFDALRVPAGFLKITPKAVHAFMRAWPELLYGDADHPSLDMFNHGVIDGVWYGEDYAFCKRWKERCGDIWLVPDLYINHHSISTEYPGNLHNFMRRQPGGELDPARIAA